MEGVIRFFAERPRLAIQPERGRIRGRLPPLRPAPGVGMRDSRRSEGFSHFRASYWRGIKDASLRTIVMATAALAAGTNRADAGFTVNFVGTTAVPGDGTIFGYTLNFTPGTGETLVAGNYATIYDFGPTTSLSIPAVFTASQNLLGTTPSFGGVPTDNPSILNVTLTYTGPTLTTTTPFINIQLVSSNTGTRSSDYRTLDGPVGGQQSVTAGVTTVPGLAVPEPTSVVMMGMGAWRCSGCCAGARRPDPCRGQARDRRFRTDPGPGVCPRRPGSFRRCRDDSYSGRSRDPNGPASGGPSQDRGPFEDRHIGGAPSRTGTSGQLHRGLATLDVSRSSTIGSHARRARSRGPCNLERPAGTDAPSFAPLTTPGQVWVGCVKRTIFQWTNEMGRSWCVSRTLRTPETRQSRATGPGSGVRRRRDGAGWSEGTSGGVGATLTIGLPASRPGVMDSRSGGGPDRDSKQ
jgi:hypothetical protein